MSLSSFRTQCIVRIDTTNYLLDCSSFTIKPVPIYPGGLSVVRNVLHQNVKKDLIGYHFDVQLNWDESMASYDGIITLLKALDSYSGVNVYFCHKPTWDATEALTVLYNAEEGDFLNEYDSGKLNRPCKLNFKTVSTVSAIPAWLET